ncbi:MAG: dihydropteroate synthase [Pseudomonadota bacterium]
MTANPSLIEKFSQILFGEPGTKIMGVINTTPDSFSDGGINFTSEVAIRNGLSMLEDGAHILDIGGESTRPGSGYTNVDEEIRRVVPVISGICRQRPDTIMSIDTRRMSVAKAAIQAGAIIINDISGFRDDPKLAILARDTRAFMIVMHMLGVPRTMQKEIHYESFPEDIFSFFEERISYLEKVGVSSNRIILDPGIGFGKTFDQNLTLINRLDHFLKLKKPLLMGPSRKAFLGKIVNEPIPSKRDLATMAAVSICVCRGSSIVRVHDVKSAAQICKVTDAILREKI